MKIENKTPIAEEIIRNNPTGYGLFAGIGDNFNSVAQVICELMDDAVSNLRANSGDPELSMRVVLSLENLGDAVEITVTDGGTGIADLGSALTIACWDGALTPLNEHSFGLKHALASCDSSPEQKWSIRTRTKADAAANQYREVKAPYSMGTSELDKPMKVRFYSGTGDLPHPTGTSISVRCPMAKFRTVKPDRKAAPSDFHNLVRYIIEELRYIYAGILANTSITMEVWEILSQPAADIAAALIDRLDVEASKRDRGIHRITALIDSLRGMEPETTDYMLLSVYHMYDDREFLDANLYSKSELPAELAPLPDILAVKGINELAVDETEQAARAIQLPQCYAFELSPWHEVLGDEVNIANAREVGFAAFCAAVLYEMTFFGFDEKTVDAERQKLYDSLHEAEELDKLPPEERAKYFFSAEEVFAGLGIPEPSEEERQEAHRQMCREMLINSLRTYRMLEKYMNKQ